MYRKGVALGGISVPGNPYFLTPKFGSGFQINGSPISAWESKISNRLLEGGMLLDKCGCVYVWRGLGFAVSSTTRKTKDVNMASNHWAHSKKAVRSTPPWAWGVFELGNGPCLGSEVAGRTNRAGGPQRLFKMITCWVDFRKLGNLLGGTKKCLERNLQTIGSSFDPKNRKIPAWIRKKSKCFVTFGKKNSIYGVRTFIRHYFNNTLQYPIFLPF